MSVLVEHDKRRKKILDSALTVFMNEGFENATFQKIADHCGIARTILYLYFKNKREIFLYSLKQLLLEIEEILKSIRSDSSMKSEEKLTKTLLTIFKLLEQNKRLIAVLLDYLLHISKEGANPEDRVRRRTIKLRHILSSMYIEGVKNGELKKIKIKAADDYLYSFIESAVYQLAVLKRKNVNELKETVLLAVKQLTL
ncbi:MAG: TetR/AcrR family transcriptional regulator [Treponema sp.]|nr:TetR/AcrR family transcriptional regulator [Treponema sp.]